MIGLLAALILVGAPASAQGAQYPASVADPRLQTLRYDAGQVFPVRVPLGFQTTLILDPNERVENLALGDSDAWQVTPNRRGDHVFIKPLRATGTTNLTVVTDARVYIFELSTSYGPTAQTPYTIRFQYPDAATAAGAADTSSTLPQSQYRLSGSRDVQPLSVSDDGIRTFIEWGPDQTLPAIFALDDRRREVLVNGHMRDGRYVIDAVYPTLLFKLDRQTARASRIGGDRR